MRRKEREITDIREIESIINKSDVCRIAMSEDNTPYIVTMNFGYSADGRQRLYFHCAPEGKKVEILKKNNLVCFEMDTDHDIKEGPDACGFGMKYSSVVGWGNISIVSEEEEKREGLNSVMRHYSDRTEFKYDREIFDRTTVLRLEIISMTGKKA